MYVYTVAITSLCVTVMAAENTTVMAAETTTTMAAVTTLGQAGMLFTNNQYKIQVFIIPCTQLYAWQS
jgi:hypothetical protein